MRAALVILFLGIIYLLCGSRSCSNEDSPGAREKARLNAARDSIVETFETDFLSDTDLHGYELTAIQKLEDLSHYFNILNDTSAVLIFRKKAAEMFAAAFISQHTKVDLKVIEQGIPLEMSLFIDNALSNRYADSKLFISSIKKFESLTKQNDTLYNGKLQFRVARSIHDQAGRITGSGKLALIDIHVVRVVKSFGKEKIKVWKVFLGEMREI